jgi:hypothetical protein
MGRYSRFERSGNPHSTQSDEMSKIAPWLVILFLSHAPCETLVAFHGTIMIHGSLEWEFDR